MHTFNKMVLGTVATAAGLVFSVSALAADITGAGATFPYAVYTKWPVFHWFTGLCPIALRGLFQCRRGCAESVSRQRYQRR